MAYLSFPSSQSLSSASYDHILNKLPAPKSSSQICNAVTLRHSILGTDFTFIKHGHLKNADVNPVKNGIYDIDNVKFTPSIS